MYRLYGKSDWASLAVHMALEEIGAPFEYVDLGPDDTARSTAPYLAMNPFGLVPVLDTPDGAMHETTAILLYLADRHGMLAPQVAAPDRGVFLVWLAAVCQQMHPAVMQLLHPYRLLGAAHAPAVAQAAQQHLHHFVGIVERQAAKGVWWLTGTRPSILAMYIAMLLRWAQAESPDPALGLNLAAYPALHKMAQDLEVRAPIARVLDREGLFARGANPLSAPPRSVG